MGSIRDAWVGGDPVVASWLGRRVDRLDDRRQAVAQAGRLDPRVAAALAEQNAAMPASPARSLALDAVVAGTATFVVTGQQLGYLGGPLYAIHKTASAIALARRLSRESGQTVVPLFWMQSEDHDFAEIAEAKLLDRAGGAHALMAERDALPDRASIGHRRLVADVDADRLRSILRGLPHAEPVCALLGESFSAHRRIVDAWQLLLGALFGDTELLVLNPRSEAIARLAAPLHAWSIDASTAIEDALVEQSREIERAGYSTQIAARPGVALSNVHPDGIEGARWRLQRSDDGWVAAGSGQRIAEAILRRWLDDEPLRWSTSALLRPIVQDALLPTVAYVGGPGEVAYLAQIGPLYKLAGVRRPMVVARPTLVWLPAEVAATLREHELRVRDLAGGIDAVVARTAFGREATATATAIARRLESAVDAAIAAEPILRSSESLTHQSQRMRQAFGQSVDKLAERVARELCGAVGGPVERLRTASRWLYPSSTPQERTAGFATFAALAGVTAWVEQMIAASDPIEASERYLELSE